MFGTPPADEPPPNLWFICRKLIDKSDVSPYEKRPEFKEALQFLESETGRNYARKVRNEIKEAIERREREEEKEREESMAYHFRRLMELSKARES